ncbi:MAG TPA: 5'/3'-nucleotidase SurE, partial [Acidimicrobiales bacterium]
LVDVSGTVGAARSAVRAGVPAVAVSQGLGASPEDYAATAALVVTWIEDHRDAIVAGDLPTDLVTNINVPTCTAGEVRGTLEVASATGGDPLAPADCTSTGEGFADDVTAFANGYATTTEVGVEPGVPVA